jgi:zinc protease
LKAVKRSGIELRPLKLPHHDVRRLPNGLTVHLIPRGPLPLVAVRLVTRAGSVFDPRGLLGVGDFASRLMRRGAAGLTANQISDQVEFVGASVGGFANEENAIVSLSTPSQHLEAMFEIFTKVVLLPDYADSEVELSRRRVLAQLSNELDDPGALADRALSRAVWGTHPYSHEARSGKADYVAFQRKDLVAFHQQRLGPAISHLYVTGNFKAEAMMKLVERTLGGWRNGPAQPPVIPTASGIARPGEVLIVDKPEQTQVQVRIGAPGVKRGHEDHFPLMVMNTVLGGGFTSRLVTEIRVKRGLSYGAGSGFDMMSAGGAFNVSSFTKTETLPELLAIALAEVQKMKSKGPNATEVATVQRYIAGLYPARLETNEAIAGALADVVHYGLTDEWISQYRERIAAVTVKEAARAAEKHLFDKDRVIVLVGNAAKLAPKVKKYGQVTVLKPAELE